MQVAHFTNPVHTKFVSHVLPYNLHLLRLVFMTYLQHLLTYPDTYSWSFPWELPAYWIWSNAPRFSLKHTSIAFKLSANLLWLYCLWQII